MFSRRFMFALYSLLVPAMAMAELQVVATTTSMQMLANEVGGAHVEVHVLAPPDRDAHSLQAKPSMMRHLRNADLVVAVGAGLEVGWLPAAIRSSANPSIASGSKGYFEATQQVDLIDQQPPDRSRGDVHPQGNPHVNLDPVRMARIGKALATRLSEIDSEHSQHYQRNARRLAQSLESQTQHWQQQIQSSLGVVLYHRDGLYLLRRFNIPVLGYVEPLPGIPPSASHIRKLVTQLQDEKGILIRAPFHDSRGVDRLAKQLDWPAFVLPLEPPLGADADGYIGMIEQWITAVAGSG